MGLAIYGTLYLTSNFVDMQTTLGIASQGSVALIVGLVAYLLITWLWKCEEIDALKVVFKRIGGIRKK